MPFHHLSFPTSHRHRHTHPPWRRLFSFAQRNISNKHQHGFILLSIAVIAFLGKKIPIIPSEKKVSSNTSSAICGCSGNFMSHWRIVARPQYLLCCGMDNSPIIVSSLLNDEA
jgi:hypothetical protein